MPMDPGPCLWDLPDPAVAEPGQDLLAVGADLSPSTILEAYRRGLFPMHVETEELGWWSPDPRGIVPLANLRVTRSLRRSMHHFEFSVDQAFAEVMRGCSEGRKDGDWINEEFHQAYGQLHRMGWAHSVEVWQGGTLVGGLYGIEIGGLFAGESMFHRVRDASKAALVILVETLRSGGGDPESRLLDVQWCTDHLATLGAVEVPRRDYLAALDRALGMEPALGLRH